MENEHAALIEALGGASALGKRLGVKANVAGNWPKQGIPWKYRHAVAEFAARDGIALPDGFLFIPAEEPERAA